MYHILGLALFLGTISTSSAQRNEFGVFLGGSYYNGELNPSKHVVVAQPAAGIFFDSHINSRYTWRTAAMYGMLKADDHLTDIGLNTFRDLQMTARVVELSGQLHFNFLPFGNGINVKHYTPYIFIGLSLYNVNPTVSSMNSDTITATPKESYTRSQTSVAIPFGAGFKASYKVWTIGIQWSFRKTFTDSFDGIDNQYATGNVNSEPVQFTHPKGFQKGILYTNDWYSFIGITLSYRPMPKKNACPGMN